ncbi:MAG: phage portal protein [Sinimarinibacterium sp.]|jgi:lambda family phage portal protein
MDERIRIARARLGYVDGVPQVAPGARSARSISRRVRPDVARSFSGASTGNLNHSWTTQDRHLNQSLQQNLRTLRARSRDLERNNDYAKHFLRLVTDNVAGPAGVMLQVHAKRPDGEIDQADSNYCEDRFFAWGTAAGNCDIAARLNWIQQQRLLVRTVARDGEVLIRRWRGKGPFGYQLQLLDPALLNEHYSEDLPGGRRIRMGVEVDEFDKPIAYHLSRRNVNDPRVMLGYDTDCVRVPASEIWHIFIPEGIGQYRGVPWMATTLTRQKRLNSYQEAALAAAEEGAKKLAFIRTPDGDLAPMADGAIDESGNNDPTSGTLYTDSQDIHYGKLSPGYGIEQWDPKYPEANYTPFVTDHVRAIGSGLGVAYHKLANNLEGVSFSSIRSGELSERDVWLGLQQFLLIDSFCAPAYSEWLPLSILSGQVNLPMAKLAKFDAALWQGRRWDWVDPEKDVTANLKAISARLTSRRRVILKMGLDPEEVWAECDAEEKRFGPLVIGPEPPPQKPKEGTADE